MKTHNRIFLAGLILLLFLALVPFRESLAQNEEPYIRVTQVDNSRFPEVIVYISVTNAAGEPLAVDPSKIRVFENGKLMQPDQINGSGEIGSLTTLLVMDISGSMYEAGKLRAAKAAALAYIDQMRPGDQAGLMTFNTDVTCLQAITGDRLVLTSAINSLNAKGDTAMFDALDQAVEVLQDYPGRKAIIVLTDGLDNRSVLNSEDVLQAIGTGGLSISTIGLGDPDKLGINSGLDEAALRSLAKRAGGMYGYANDAVGLLGLYERYGRTLQSEYRITYRSPSTLRDGISRTLTVSLGELTSMEAQYNPGGVLPEVSKSASWLIFFTLLATLIVLLVMPALISRIPALKKSGSSLGISQKQKSRVKLK